MTPSETPPPAASSSSAPVAPTGFVTPPTAFAGNFPVAIGAGLLAALVGAAIWAAVTVATEYQIGWMAIGVGFLVGIAIRTFGKGSDEKYAYLGAGLALLGCMLGNLLTIVAVVAKVGGTTFFSVLGNLDPSSVIELLTETFQPMDLLFYGLAVYAGFKGSRVPRAPEPA